MADRRVEVFKDEKGEWRWTRYHGAEPMSDSDEGYDNKSYCWEKAAELNPGLDVILREETGAE